MQGGSWLGGSLLSGVLAGLFSLGAYTLVSMNFLPKTGSNWLPDLSGLILIAGLVYSLVFGALGGIVGGLAARMYWRTRGSRRDRSPA